eukprot:TRINITY_DN1925_c0_g2_i4.p1 TRINITY_DN1925_c0_g2~~TRINITY_DN1925_c0_g2_i4.p1  ORF type:complete len:724 (+),score=181.24 TRINITY_DN1925_c0_g2_i4:378-2549(+)
MSQHGSDAKPPDQDAPSVQVPEETESRKRGDSGDSQMPEGLEMHFDDTSLSEAETTLLMSEKPPHSKIFFLLLLLSPVIAIIAGYFSYKMLHDAEDAEVHVVKSLYMDAIDASISQAVASGVKVNAAVAAALRVHPNPTEETVSIFASHSGKHKVSFLFTSFIVNASAPDHRDLFYFGNPDTSKNMLSEREQRWLAQHLMPALTPADRRESTGIAPIVPLPVVTGQLSLVFFATPVYEQRDLMKNISWWYLPNQPALPIGDFRGLVLTAYNVEYFAADALGSHLSGTDVFIVADELDLEGLQLGQTPSRGLVFSSDPKVTQASDVPSQVDWLQVQVVGSQWSVGVRLTPKEEEKYTSSTPLIFGATMAVCLGAGLLLSALFVRHVHAQRHRENLTIDVLHHTACAVSRLSASNFKFIHSERFGSGPLLRGLRCIVLMVEQYTKFLPDSLKGQSQSTAHTIRNEGLTQSMLAKPDSPRKGSDNPETTATNNLSDALTASRISNPLAVSTELRNRIFTQFEGDSMLDVGFSSIKGAVVKVALLSPECNRTDTVSLFVQTLQDHCRKQHGRVMYVQGGHSLLLFPGMGTIEPCRFIRALAKSLSSLTLRFGIASGKLRNGVAGDHRAKFCMVLGEPVLEADALCTAASILSIPCLASDTVMKNAVPAETFYFIDTFCTGKKVYALEMDVAAAAGGEWMYELESIASRLVHRQKVCTIQRGGLHSVC